MGIYSNRRSLESMRHQVDETGVRQQTKQLRTRAGLGGTMSVSMQRVEYPVGKRARMAGRPIHVRLRLGRPAAVSGKWQGCETAAASYRLACHLGARSLRLNWDVLHARSRSRAVVALSRQISMYLGHVSCGHSYTNAGAWVGRDRTTAAHACQRVEALRDEPCWDLGLDYLDAVLRRWTGQGMSCVSAGAIAGKRKPADVE